MEGLDFSALSDDQLLGLVRAALREIVQRSPALSEAARSAMLDEHERATIAAHATDREAARLRALERARVATEAAARVRAEHEAAERAVSDARAAAAGDEARTKAEHAQDATKVWLRRAAALVDRKPADITLLLLNTRYGRRVLIDSGADTFTSDHLSDWTAGTGAISTIKALLKRKPDLAALSAEFESRNTGRTCKHIGANFDWSNEP